MLKLINLRRIFLYFRGRVKYLVVITVVGGLLGAGAGLALFSREHSEQPHIFADYFFSVSPIGTTSSTPSADAIAFFAGSYFLARVAEDVFPTDSSQEIIERLGITSGAVGEQSAKEDVLAKAIWLYSQGTSTFSMRIGSFDEGLNRAIGDSVVAQMKDLPIDVQGGLRVKLLSTSVTKEPPKAPSSMMLQYVRRYAVIGLAFGFSITLCALLFMYVFSRTVYAKEDFAAFSDVPDMIIDDKAQSDEYVADACYSVLPDGPKVIGVSSTAGDEVSSGYARTICDALSRGGLNASVWTSTEDGLEGLIKFANAHEIVIVPVPDITVDPLVYRVGRGIQGMVMAERIGDSDLLVFERAVATLKGHRIPLLRVVLR